MDLRIKRNDKHDEFLLEFREKAVLKLTVYQNYPTQTMENDFFYVHKTQRSLLYLILLFRFLSYLTLLQ